ncbi:MAG: hypothetical protein U0166_18640 [Acidobacteriota bacterium]
MSLPRPPRGRRAVFALLAAVLAYAAVELCAWGIGVALFGGVRWISAIHRNMRSVLEQGAAAGEAAGPVASPGETKRREVVHPFVGFVADQHPEGSDPAGPAFGFRIDPPRVGANPGAFVVGIFGGSVAEQLAEGAGGPALREALSASGKLAGRPVEIVDLAMSGYKQPQQLMTLAYFYANGARFDVVANLDGFNEVAIAAFENAARGAPAAYPRYWSRYNEKLDPEALSRGSMIIATRERRRAAASAFVAWPLAWSPTAALIWQRWDQRQRGKEQEHQLWLLAHAAASPPWKPEGREPELVRIWADASIQMQRLAAANGARYFHFLQPNIHVDGSKPLTEKEAWREWHPYRPFARAGYPLLRSRGAELTGQGVRFTDLTMAFAEVREPIYVDACCHVNDEGNRILASRIAAAILDDTFDPKGAPPRR